MKCSHNTFCFKREENSVNFLNPYLVAPVKMLMLYIKKPM